MKPRASGGGQEACLPLLYEMNECYMLLQALLSSLPESRQGLRPFPQHPACPLLFRPSLPTLPHLARWFVNPPSFSCLLLWLCLGHGLRLVLVVLPLRVRRLPAEALHLARRDHAHQQEGSQHEQPEVRPERGVVPAAG